MYVTEHRQTLIAAVFNFHILLGAHAQFDRWDTEVWYKLPDELRSSLFTEQQPWSCYLEVLQ